ncbi:MULTISPECIES: hypothetical protein [unclassified Thioalkalivibrio]|uniref:hypothetical protein n=1 Tax=unclassified Thioalkalivibrio TaxID=2621013 RepID=UPI000379FCE5|nr:MULTISPECIES: hypothetical protein [unclassified Thioalkalivibrio]
MRVTVSKSGDHWQVRAEEGTQRGEIIARAQSVGLTDVEFLCFGQIGGNLLAFEGVLTKEGLDLTDDETSHILRAAILPTMTPSWHRVEHHPTVSGAGRFEVSLPGGSQRIRKARYVTLSMRQGVRARGVTFQLLAPKEVAA